jgi:glycosyltransferase involved in cell wall biosynthesis
MATPDIPGSIFFSFADPVGFSGQKAATELVIKGLSARGWACRRLPLPVLRDSGRPTGPVSFAAGLLAAWGRALRLSTARGAWLCVNIGQTRSAFIRDGVPLLIGRASLGRRRICIVLHGSLFMRWARDSFDARAFVFLLGNAGVVTVLGESQRARLIDLGIPASRVIVVVNSCDAEVLSEEAVRAKHDPHRSGPRRLKLLFLSSLIDTKGYPEFLGAVRRLAEWGGPAIEAVVCGRVAPSEFSERFRDTAAAENWIQEQVDAINRSSRSTARWVKGAVGAEKAALLREADVFVLPTRYPVEAQPVALLEAMASGCAIVTTRAGEIPTILDGDCAVMLETASTDSVEAALQTLVINPERRLRLGSAALKRFVDRYGVERHLDNWEAFLEPARPAKGAGP